MSSPNNFYGHSQLQLPFKRNRDVKYIQFHKVVKLKWEAPLENDNSLKHQWTWNIVGILGQGQVLLAFTLLIRKDLPTRQSYVLDLSNVAAHKTFFCRVTEIFLNYFFFLRLKCSCSPNLLTPNGCLHLQSRLPANSIENIASAS